MLTNLACGGVLALYVELINYIQKTFYDYFTIDASVALPGNFQMLYFVLVPNALFVYKVLLFSSNIKNTKPHPNDCLLIYCCLLKSLNCW